MNNKITNLGGSMQPFSQLIEEIIKKRFSCRNYLPQTIPGQKADKLNEILADCSRGPLGSPMRFQLVSVSENDSAKPRKLGTYGFIKGAESFIAGAVKATDTHLEEYGFMMEKIILAATDLGLGTCWLGGSFSRSNFSNSISLQAAEIIPAVTPVGIINPEKRIGESLTRQLLKANSRKPWEELFFSDNWLSPLSQNEAGIYSRPLAMVRLAPSAENGQPWRILKTKEKNRFHFCLQRKQKTVFRKLLEARWADLQRLDMGIAMAHFQLTAEEMGLRGEWQRLPQPPVISDSSREYAISWLG